MTTHRKIVTQLCPTLAVFALFAATVAARQAPQTTTELQKGQTTITEEKMSGEVVYVKGNNLVVRMSTGELRTFSNIPDSRRATVDGKQVGVRDLQPGTMLTATITRTSTPIAIRTVTVGTATVRFVAGNNVTLELPSGEHRQYVVKPDYNFMVNGKPATVAQLKPGMTVAAEKIVQENQVALTENTAVVGQAPRR